MDYKQPIKPSILLDDLLLAEGKRRLPLPQSGNNLFHAFSHLLYSTTMHHARLRALLTSESKIKYFSLLEAEDSAFGEAQICDHLLKPLSPQFESLNLELFSRLFRFRVKVYYLNAVNICCDVYNGEGVKTVKLVRVHDFHYEPLVSARHLDACIFVQNLVLNLVERAVDEKKEGWADMDGGRLVNYSMKNRANEVGSGVFEVRSITENMSDRYLIDPIEKGSRTGVLEMQKLIEKFSIEYPVDYGYNSENEDCKLKATVLNDSYENLGLINATLDSSYPQIDPQFQYYGLDSNVLSAWEDYNAFAHISSPEENIFMNPTNVSPNNPKMTEHTFQASYAHAQYLPVTQSPGTFTLPQNHRPDETDFDPFQPLPVLDKFYMEENKKYQGILKFFDDKNNFGFLTLLDYKNTDIFVFGSEFQKANIPISVIKSSEYGQMVKFQFMIVFYWGRHGKSKKAVNISVI